MTSSEDCTVSLILSFVSVNRYYLDVQHAKKDAQTRVWVYAENGTDAQLWRFDDNGRLERYVCVSSHM